MKSIASDSPAPADLKKFGLDKPDATVNLNTGSSRATLLIGGKAAEGSVYARDVSKPRKTSVLPATVIPAPGCRRCSRIVW